MRIGLVGAGRIGAVHAENLARLASVSSIVIADAEPSRARELARRHGAESANDPAELLSGVVDAVVIAAATAAHAELVCAAARARLPVFCEKPIARDLNSTRAVLERVAEAGVPLHVGFQRRFDAGYLAVREAVRSGSLGRVHTLRACTCDPAPPPPAYLPDSGGLFRDCAVHDFDAIRWVTGHEIVSIFAVGTAGGAPFFAEAGDVDTAAAVLRLDDDSLATVTATRYNGAGYDVRLEASGSAGTLVAGLGPAAPLVPADPVSTGEPRPVFADFHDRFGVAYAAELDAFVEVAAGHRPSPCTGADALAALSVAEAAELSRAEARQVALEEVGATL